MTSSSRTSWLVPRTGLEILQKGISIVNKQALSANKLNPDFMSGF